MACEGLDLSKINRDEFVADNETVWIKAQVLEKTYRLDGESYTVIEFSDGCFNVVCEDQNKINSILLFVADNLFQAQEDDDDALIKVPSSGVKRNENGAICGIPDLEKFEEAVKAVDSNAINQFGFQPAALMPNACCIPLRSNIKIYGPYVSSNFNQCGGTNSESDPDLCPWAFGSAALMNAAGNAKANSYPANFTPEVETGSIALPELPNINLGSSPAGGGPNLTGINISFGSSGINTNYTFQTYTPKAGGFTRLFIDRLKNIAKYRQEQIKFLRNNRLDVNKINRRLRVVNNIARGGNNPRDEARANQPTAQRVLIGEMYDFHPDVSGQRTVVAMTTLPKAIQEMRYDFDKKAYMSLDGLLGPVSTNGGGGLPLYTSYSGLTEDPQCHRASPTLPNPPFATGNGITTADDIQSLDQYNLIIERKNINPLTNPNVNDYRGDSDPNTGHAIDIVGRPEETLEEGVIMNFYLNDKNGSQYADDYRFLALRGPLVLHSWGFDTQGKPIPNIVDSEENTAEGKFEYENLKDKFIPDWLKKPRTWPVAPVDLRFDRDRGVWVSPPSYQIVVAKLEEDLDPYQKALGSIITKNLNDQEYGRPFFDKEGNKVETQEDKSKAKIVIIDRIGQSFKKDSLVYVYYDTHKCEYIILSGGQPKSPIIRFKLIDICPDLVAPPVDDTWGDNWTEYAGYGDKFFDNISITDSYALRLDCNGEPIDRSGNILTDIDVDTIKEHLIIVRDVAGKWGPAFSRFTDFETWKKRAAEGYAAKIINPIPSGSGSSSSSSEECDLRTPCLITYIDENGDTQTIDENYDIIYLESYARFIHGCLKQDLYTKEGDDSYQDDYWKNLYPSGNALIEVEKFYGYSDNGKEPYFLDKDGQEVEIRVFDPWVNSSGEAISCYNAKEYQFYSAKSGTPVVAVFNETLKRYDIIEIAQKPAKAIRFKLFGCKQTEAATPDWGQDDGDAWTEYAGFFDKIPNHHILGVRIDCDGNPVDRNGVKLTSTDITLDNPNKKDIFVNLFDTSGKWGPSFAGYKNFEHWIEHASNGFATLCEIPPSGNCESDDTCCKLGKRHEDCPIMDPELDSYDITYLESYARYIHGCLSQDLYITEEKAAQKYPDDYWKISYPSGNAAVQILKYYGGPDNEQEPKFWNNDIEELPVRVFDPWISAIGEPLIVEGEPESCYKPENGPFYNAKAGTPFIAIFNEKKKRYELVQIALKQETAIRFKLFKKCESDEVPNYGDDWTQYAGYRDKFPNYHSLGVRINCNGEPIDINGQIINDADLNDPQKAENIFVNLLDSAGKFGPSYSEYRGNFGEWVNKAFNGLALKIKIDSKAIECDDLGTNSSCAEFDENYPTFDIVFLESYARFLHGCLDQDLYPSSGVLAKYAEDEYKIAHPSGNAAISSEYIYYGDSPNGKQPLFINSDNENIKIRVFDPWLDQVDCYDPKKSQFYNATSGTAFTAIFDETKKKYYLWNIDQKPKTYTIRFRLIDCSVYDSGLIFANNNMEAFADPWVEYASYLDKFRNNHVVGVRIDCDGNPLNKQGSIIDEQTLELALIDANLPEEEKTGKAENVFINLFDTCGNHGPAFSAYITFSDWKENAATGFATVCDPVTSGCELGVSPASGINPGPQCLDIDTRYDSYDILFLESYARFVECTLTQDLYALYEGQYPEDEYKSEHPLGNATANIYNMFDTYGDSPNGRYPRYFKEDGALTEFRVFDPFIDTDPDENPFRKLKEGDKVLCVFNEKLKKYTIYNSITEQHGKVIKFALVSDKQLFDKFAYAILVNEFEQPIEKDGQTIIVDQNQFNANIIIVKDPYLNNSDIPPPVGPGSIPGETSAFGPALGSDLFPEHIRGIELPDGYRYKKVGPFIGYAMAIKAQDGDISYNIIALESYAKYIVGKIGTLSPSFGGKFLGARLGHRQGVIPLGRNALPQNLNCAVKLNLTGFNGINSYVLGDIIDNPGQEDIAADTDGCKFIAALDTESSTTSVLVYDIIECETVATTCDYYVPNQEEGNKLNKEFTTFEHIQGNFLHGFIWDQNKSTDHFNAIRLYNNGVDRNDQNTGEIIANGRGLALLTGINNDGDLIYTIVTKSEIANIVQRYISNEDPGLFGFDELPQAERSINNSSDYFWDGQEPDAGELTPKIDLIDSQQWMTYEQGILIGSWDEYGNRLAGFDGNVNDCKYKIIYAQEAPVIITCRADEEFTPNQEKGIKLKVNNDSMPSCQGIDRTPVYDILDSAFVFNPMGYGAKTDDFVTVQRVFMGIDMSTVEAGHPKANYKYIVIGTSHPPGNLK